MTERAQIDKGLKHLAGSEEIIGNIVAYCVNAHKADPSAKTMDKIRQYVSDTANSVCGHVLTIAHNINSIIDKESKEIEEMSFEVEYAAHRLKSHQQYMSQLYMTKFQTLPRPKPVIHILRKTIPNDKLPKFARPKKPWVRQGIFDYSILDQVSSGKKRKAQTSASGEGGNNQQQQQQKAKSMNQIQPKAAVQAFNPYESMMGNNGNDAKKDAISPVPPKATTPVSPNKNKSLYQIEKEAKLKKKSSSADVGPAPPSFSAAAPPSFSNAAPPSFSSAAVDKPKKEAPKQPPAIPKVPPVAPQNAAGPPPPVPGGGGPPPVPPVPSNAMMPPKPPQPPQPPQPPSVPQ